MAPAVKQTLETAVNSAPGLHMGDAQGRADAVAFFGDDYPAASPLHVLGAEDDLIVRKREVSNLFSAALAGDAAGELQLYWLPGSHIGFMDGFQPEFDVPEPLNTLVAKPLFILVNVLLYRLEVRARVRACLGNSSPPASAAARHGRASRARPGCAPAAGARRPAPNPSRRRWPPPSAGPFEPCLGAPCQPLPSPARPPALPRARAGVQAAPR
jgi:hypothetical protein